MIISIVLLSTKILMILKNCHSILCTKNWINLMMKLLVWILIHEKKNTKELKNKVLSNARNLYNDLYYIYKDKYNKEINSLNTKNRIKLDYKKLRLADDYEYLSEEEQEEKQKEEQ